MEAYRNDENTAQDKGLFTFYLEQAELEDKTKASQIQQHSQHQLLRKEKRHKKVPFHLSPQQKLQLDARQREEGKQLASKEGKMPREEPPTKAEQTGDRKGHLIELLQRAKYRPLHLRNFRAIAREGQIGNSQYLENLSVLLRQEKKKNSQSAFAGETDEKQKIGEQALFAGRYDPFQKLYLSPKNFQSELREHLSVNISGPNRSVQPLRTKAYDSQILQPKKIESSVELSVQRQTKNKSTEKTLIQYFHKNFLPKLDTRCPSLISHNMVPSSRLHKAQSSRLQKSRAQLKAKSDRSHYKDQSLLIESARYNADRVRSRRQIENRLYPVFVESCDTRKLEEESLASKEQLYSELLKKLKFK